jgi:hypothetical protein
VAVAALVASTTALAQLSDLEQEAVDTYTAAVRAVESQPAGGGGLEAAIYALAPIRDALTRARDSRWTMLESLTEDEFQRVKRELPGAIVTRDKVVFIGPDPDYFVTLAGTRGSPADRAFFAAYKATYPDAVWPVYLQPGTGPLGCTRFGSGSLVSTYRTWDGFQTTYPGRYAIPTRREVDRVQSALAQSTCACGDAASVAREMEAFVKAFEASPIRARLLERIEALRTGRSDIRTSCTSS